MSDTVSGSFSEMRECMCTDKFTYIIEKYNVKICLLKKKKKNPEGFVFSQNFYYQHEVYSPHYSMFWLRTTHRSKYSYLFLRQCGNIFYSNNVTAISDWCMKMQKYLLFIYLFEGYSEYLSKSK